MATSQSRRKYTGTMPDGPPGAPLVGNLLDFRRDPLTFLSQSYKQYGDLVTLRLFGRAVAVFGPEYVHLVTSAPDEEVRTSTMPGFWLQKDIQGRGPLNAYGDEHRRVREISRRALAGEALKSYYNITCELTERRLERWTVGSEINLVPEMIDHARRIFKYFMFGVDIVGERPDLNDAVDTYVSTLRSQLLFVGTSLIRRDIPGISLGTTFRKKRARIDDWLAQAGKQTNYYSLGQALMDAIASEGAGQDIALARDMLLQLYFAGITSIGTSLIWILLLLAQHPKECRALLDELQRALGGRVPEMQVLTQLPILDAVINESLRLYPGAGYEFRKSSPEMLKLGDYELPPNCQLVLSPWVTQHNPKVFDDPEVFKPQRFIDGQTYVKGAFEPWGVGMHACLGRVLARQVLKTVVCMIMQRRRLEIVPNQHIDIVSENLEQLVTPSTAVRMRVLVQDGEPERSALPIYGNIIGGVQPTS
jgi:cytochrome P450